MKIIVLDASVVLSWLIEEDQDAVKIYDQISRGKITAVAPDFLLIEVANVLISKRGISTQKAEEFLGNLQSGMIEFYPTRYHSRILKLAEKFELSTYDAIYGFLSSDLSFPLITNDKKLQKIPHALSAKLFVKSIDKRDM